MTDPATALLCSYVKKNYNANIGKPLRICVRIDPPHPLVCRKGRLSVSQQVWHDQDSSLFKGPGLISNKSRSQQHRLKPKRCVRLRIGWYSPVVQIRQKYV
jgi:hypothetical protein